MGSPGRRIGAKSGSLRKWKPNPLTVGVATFVLSMILLSYVAGPTVCEDGWPSPSIGSQGACSWHGGVDRGPEALRLFGSFVAGFCGWFFATRLLNKGTTGLRSGNHSGW